MKSLCMVYEALFQRLLKAVEQSDEDNCKGVHAVTCDTQYISYLIAELSNLDYIPLNLLEMSHFVGLV